MVEVYTYEGTTTYCHMAWATDEQGENFSLTEFEEATFIGRYQDDSEDESDDWTVYAWEPIDGSEGVVDEEAREMATTAGETATEALEQAQETLGMVGVLQYFWTDDEGGHWTTVPQEEFLEDPTAQGLNVLMQADGMHIRVGTTDVTTHLAEESVIGKVTQSHARITPTGLELLDGDNTYGQWKAWGNGGQNTYLKMMAGLTADDLKSQLVIRDDYQAGTISQQTTYDTYEEGVTPGDHLHLATTALYDDGESESVFVLGNADLDLFADGSLLLTHESHLPDNTDAFETVLAVNRTMLTAPGFHVAGHSSSIGDTLEGRATGLTVPTGSQLADLHSFTLPAGSWVVSASVRYGTNATGRRCAALTFGSTASNSSYDLRPPTSGGNTAISISSPTGNFADEFPVKIRGWQNSGGDLACSVYWSAVRIA